MATAFDSPMLTTDAIVLSGSGPDMRVLLIERGRPPALGLWALPGGFVEKFEQPRAAVIRELAEETGLNLVAAAGRPLRLRSRKGRDPRGWTLSQPFLFTLPSPEPVSGGDDARRAKWFRLDEVGPLAFDHGAMLCEALGLFWPGMPDADANLSRILWAFGAPKAPIERPIFFGGSFNPWHEGHSAALMSCSERDRVVVVPDYNPFKEPLAGECFFQRYRSILRAVTPLGAAVFPGFCGMEEPNPTYFWLSRANGPRSLLLGADSFLALQHWTESEKLIQILTELYVAQRQESAAAMAKQRDKLGAKAPQLMIKVLDHHDFEHVSATGIREGV